MVQISLSTSTNYEGEQNALIEERLTSLTVNFELDEPAPVGGLKVFVDSDVEQIVNRLDLIGFGANPTVENINPNLVGTSFDNSGFFVTVDEGATTASFTINVFDNNEPDTFLPETFDGLVEANFSIVAPGAVEQEDLADVGTLGDYTINPDSATSTVIFADEESQLTDAPQPPTQPPTEPPASGLPLVSLNTGPDYLVENEGTPSAHVFNITGATIPAEGIVVRVKADNLSEFDLDAISVGDGGEIVNVREDGFDIRLTDFTTLVNLPVAADREVEGLETASFSLEAGDGYEVNEDFSGGSFEIVDTAEELPINTSNRNDILSLARDIELSADNSEVTINETLGFSIGNRYQNEDGSFTYVDQSEDVDLYKFDLKTGDVISINNDSLILNNPDIIDFPEDDPFGGYMTVRVFDSEGNEVAANGFGPGPEEIFASSGDAYIEFEAPADGTYYAGISQFFNGATQRLGAPDYWGGVAYDPFTPATGDGSSFTDYPGSAEYELKFTLNPENPVLLADQRDRSNNTPPEIIDLAQGNEPTVSLNFTAATYASFDDPAVVSGEINRDDVINGSLVEGFPRQGSILNLVVTTEGDIPEEGVLVTVNSNSYLRDYFTVRTLGNPPFVPGNEFVDVVTDYTGRETGFQLRLFEPVATVALNLRTPQRGELVAPGSNGLEPSPETDGPEDVTFFLEGGDGYGVSATASQVTPTFYDSVEQAGEPSVIPEVSLAISEDTLIESEGTPTTLNFSLSEAPPEEGVLVHVKSDISGILPQFEALDGEVTGGVYPTANFDFSGFYFKVTEQEASITLPVFEDPFEEGLQSYSFALQETPLYTINEDASEVNFTIADNPDSVLEVSLSTESVAVESEGTAGILTFNLSALPADSGIEVTVDADNLPEFDVEAFTAAGGEITGITDTGFSLNIIDATATVELPPLSDSETEGVEAATFSLTESPNYLIDPDAPEAVVTLVDILEQVPSPTEEFGANDTIAEAVDLNINSFNPSATIAAALQNEEPGDDAPPGENRDATEDVDFYSFELKAGDTIKLDIDSIPFEVSPRYEGVEQRLDSELRLFDADGNELARVNNGMADGEEFSRDPYLEFTADSAGTYYAGVSQLGNRNYDPFVDPSENNGSGWFFPEIGVYFGDYELNATLVDATTEPEQPTNPGQLTTQPVFGSLEKDIIEVTGTSQLIFGGDSDDLIDASISSEGDNRIYAASGDDTVILGSSDRIVGGAGDDKFFVTSGGDNVITGGAGADQFWIATAEIPDAANIITDFTSGEDVLGIAGLGIGFDDLSITQQDDNTLIAVNNSELAILQGISADSLIAENFVFA